MIKRLIRWLPLLGVLLFVPACIGVEQAFEEPASPAAATTPVEEEAPTADLPATLTSTPILEAVTPSAELIEESVMPTEPQPTATPQPGAQDQAQSQSEPEPLYPASVEPLIALAKEDLAQRQSIDAGAVEVVSFESKVWPDSSLGCPQPDMMYLQVLTEGYLIALRSGDVMYYYHGGEGRDKPFLCEQDTLPQPGTKQAPRTLKETPTIEVPPPRD